MDNELGGAKPDYIAYLAQLAEELDTGIPWTMCHGQHFNGSLLTCNGVGGSNDGCRKFAKSQLAAGSWAARAVDRGRAGDYASNLQWLVRRLVAAGHCLRGCLWIQWYDRFGQAQSLRNSSSSARGTYSEEWNAYMPS